MLYFIFLVLTQSNNGYRCIFNHITFFSLLQSFLLLYLKMRTLIDSYLLIQTIVAS